MLLQPQPQAALKPPPFARVEGPHSPTVRPAAGPAFDLGEPTIGRVRLDPSTPREMPAAWSYARTSTARQAGADKSGMQRQEQALADWLAAHPDHVLQQALVDPGVSGSGAHRRSGALGAFIRAAQAGTVPAGSVLIVESITRFSREVERQVLGVLLNDFWANDLGLALCGHDEIYTAELIDSQPHRLHVLLALMQQSRAEWNERSKRSKGARAAARAKQESGIRVAGRVPWFILKDADNRALRDEAGLFQLDPVAVETINMMVEMYQQGQGSQLIAVALNKAGRPTRSPRSKAWSSETVRKVLRDRSLVGEAVRAAGNVPNYWPAVMSAATFEQLAAITAANDTGSPRNRGSATQNLFATVGRCANCGGPVSVFRGGNGTISYVTCRNAVRKIGDCPHSRYVRQADWEAMGLAMLRSAQWDQLLARPGDNDTADQLKRELDEVISQHLEVGKQLELAQARADQAWLSEVSEERQATIERVLTTLREQLAGVSAHRQKLEQQLAALQAQPSSQDQAALLASRLQEYRSKLDDLEQRRSFNKWLRTREPQIRLLLHPNSRVQLCVGDTKGPVIDIAGDIARIALNMSGTDLTQSDAGMSFEAPDHQSAEFDPPWPEDLPEQQSAVAI